MDLSKIKVRGEEAQKCTEKYKKAKVVHTILQRVAINNDIELLKLYKELIWPLIKDKDDYKALDVFKQAAQSPDPQSFFKGAKVKEEVLAELVRQIAVKLSPHSIRIKADFEITCFTYEGIDAIRDALLAGIQVGTVDQAAEAKTSKPAEVGAKEAKPAEVEKLAVQVLLLIILTVLDPSDSTTSVRMRNSHQGQDERH